MFSTETAATQLTKVGADGHVSADDVRYLRGEVFRDGIVSRDELAALFALGERAPDGDPEWPAFFEEAAADFFLREEEPQGYLTDEEVAYLKSLVTRGGRFANALELGLLVSLTEKAVSTAPTMSAFVAEELRRAILGKHDGAVATKRETDLVSRFIFAAGGEGNVAVTRAEAELLFDINDAAQKNGGADAAWRAFFIKAVANHLMAHIGYAPADREEAMRRHAFMSDHRANVGGVFSRMGRGGLSGALAALKGAFGAGSEKSAQGRRNEAREKDIVAAEDVTGAEADWLAERIGRDGRFTECERALLQHMKSLGADLPPKLKALAEKAA